MIKFVNKPQGKTMIQYAREIDPIERLVAICLLCFVFVFASIVAVRFIGWDREYSDGDRVGTIVKFSRKGIAVKSWEGEMNLGGVATDAQNMMVPTVFEFSVLDEKQIEPIKAALSGGHRVSLHYSQVMSSGIWTSTGYRITGVKEAAK